jgi:regulator-associated protein of mTOR
MNGHDPDAASSRRPSSTRSLSRPLMLRAKSDFGPRHFESPPSDSGADEAASAEGQFRIRHGWDDQLNSEEYNQLLTSVGMPRPAGTWAC